MDGERTIFLLYVRALVTNNGNDVRSKMYDVIERGKLMKNFHFSYYTDFYDWIDDFIWNGVDRNSIWVIYEIYELVKNKK